LKSENRRSLTKFNKQFIFNLGDKELIGYNLTQHKIT
jgi:hypothetical protein